MNQPSDPPKRVTDADRAWLRRWVKRQEDAKPTAKLPQVQPIVEESVEAPRTRRDPRREE